MEKEKRKKNQTICHINYHYSHPTCKFVRFVRKRIRIKKWLYLIKAIDKNIPLIKGDSHLEVKRVSTISKPVDEK